MSSSSSSRAAAAAKQSVCHQIGVEAVAVSCERVFRGVERDAVGFDGLSPECCLVLLRCIRVTP